MSIPLSSLSVATEINDNDLILIRQNFVDKQAQAVLMRTINIDALTELTTPASTDMMIISNGVSNFRIAYSNVSFASGTCMWFYQSNIPDGWELLDNTSGALLAVKGPGGTAPGPGSYSTPGTVQGDWQQLNVANGNPQGGLTIEQIPPHKHRMRKTKTAVNESNALGPLRGKTPEDDPITSWRYATSESTGGSGSTSTIGQENPALPHNHGANWRPASHIGILCRKK